MKASGSLDITNNKIQQPLGYIIYPTIKMCDKLGLYDTYQYIIPIRYYNNKGKLYKYNIQRVPKNQSHRKESFIII